MAWKFKFHTSEEAGPAVLIVSEKDYLDGYLTSSDISQDIQDLLVDLNCCELMEGVWEIPNTDKIRKSLTNAGLEEII